MGFPMRMAVKSALWYPVPEFEEAGYALPTSRRRARRAGGRDHRRRRDAVVLRRWRAVAAPAGSAPTGSRSTCSACTAPRSTTSGSSHEVPFDSTRGARRRSRSSRRCGQGRQRGRRLAGHPQPRLRRLARRPVHRPARLLDAPPGQLHHRLLPGRRPGRPRRQGRRRPTSRPSRAATTAARCWPAATSPCCSTTRRRPGPSMEFLATDTFGEAWAQAGGWLSPHKGFDPANYPTRGRDGASSAIGAEADRAALRRLGPDARRRSAPARSGPRWSTGSVARAASTRRSPTSTPAGRPDAVIRAVGRASVPPRPRRSTDPSPSSLGSLTKEVSCMAKILSALIALIVGVGGSILLFLLLDRGVQPAPARSGRSACGRSSFIGPALLMVASSSSTRRSSTIIDSFHDDRRTGFVGFDNYVDLVKDNVAALDAAQQRAVGADRPVFCVVVRPRRWPCSPTACRSAGSRRPSRSSSCRWRSAPSARARSGCSSTSGGPRAATRSVCSTRSGPGSAASR